MPLLRVRLTEAQRSALECCGLFEAAMGESLTTDEQVLKLSVVNMRTLVISPNTREAIARAINELSNSEDAANQERPDPSAAGAALALSNLFLKVLRLQFAEES